MDSSLHALQTELKNILADLRRTERRVVSALATLDSEVSQRAVVGSASVPPLEWKPRGFVQSPRDLTWSERAAADLELRLGPEFEEFGSAPVSARTDTDDIECGKTYYRKNSEDSSERIKVNRKVKKGTVVGDVYEITRTKADEVSGTKTMTMRALRAILGDVVGETGE